MPGLGYQSLIAVYREASFQRRVFDTEPGGDAQPHRSLQVFETFERRMGRHDMHFEGAAVFSQIPDMKMVYALDAVDRLEFVHDFLQLDVIWHCTHKQANRARH